MENLTAIRKNYPSISIKTYLCLHADLFIRSAYQIGHANYDKLQKINEISRHITDKAVGWDD